MSPVLRPSSGSLWQSLRTMRYRSPHHDRVRRTVCGSQCQMPYGESASTEVVIVTCVYYVGVMTVYTPAIYHGQVSAGSGHGDLG